MYVVIDADDDSNDCTSAGFSTTIGSKMYVLDEVCKRHYVDLVPTIIITSTDQRISIDLLRNFSQKHVALFLLLEDPDICESSDSNNIDENEAACYDVCRAAMSAITLAGVQSITLCASAYTERTVKPSVIAYRFNLSVVDYKIDELLNPSLCAKPILCVQTTLGLLSRTSKLVQESGQGTSIFPALIDSDFMYPLILAKYTCFLHAGFAWNRNGICDMLGDFVDSKILRETLSQLLFGTASEDVTDLLASTLDMLTTQRYLDVSDVPSNPESPINTRHENMAAEMFMTEKILWDLMKCNYKNVNISPMPTKEAFAEYLKVIRRAQSFFKYKVSDLSKFLLFENDGSGNNSNSPDEGGGDTALLTKESRMSIEVFEILSILHLLSAICRAIVLAYNMEEKHRQDRASNPNISFIDLMKYLQPGTKSDTVNTLLEATDFCANIWKHRYDVLYFNTGDLTGGSLTEVPKITKVNYKVLQKSLVKKYLFSKSPELPVLSVMHVVGEKLPVSINNIMAKFFGDRK